MAVLMIGHLLPRYSLAGCRGPIFGRGRCFKMQPQLRALRRSEYIRCVTANPNLGPDCGMDGTDSIPRYATKSSFRLKAHCLGISQRNTLRFRRQESRESRREGPAHNVSRILVILLSTPIRRCLSRVANESTGELLAKREFTGLLWH